jgi:hypothetical protein
MTQHTIEQLTAVVDRILGPPGRLIARSKSGFREEFPNHLAVFNAQIHIKGVTVWSGDLDLSRDESLLKQIAQEAGELYVLSEHEDRFRPGPPPAGKRFVYWTDSHDRRVGDGYSECFGWESGALLRRGDNPPSPSS